MRPAWARSWRCKSSRELATVNEAKRNCARVTERGKEAWSETAGRWTRTGYKAVPIRASRHKSAKLSWPKIRRRKSGGRAGKDRVLTWGDLALRLKGRRGNTAREVSKGRSSRSMGEGPNEKESRNACRLAVQGTRRPSHRSERRTRAVKPGATTSAVKHGWRGMRRMTQAARACFGRCSPDLNFSNRPVRTRMPGGVGGARSALTAPYPYFSLVSL